LDISSFEFIYQRIKLSGSFWINLQLPKNGCFYLWQDELRLTYFANIWATNNLAGIVISVKVLGLKFLPYITEIAATIAWWYGM